MIASDVSTVAELRDWLRERIPSWDTYGWIDDPDVVGDDGATVFSTRSDGAVMVGFRSRGEVFDKAAFATEQEAVYAALSTPLLEMVRDHLSPGGLDEIETRPLPRSTVGRPHDPPPEGRWAVVADRATLLVCYLTGTELHVRARTPDPQEAARVVAELHAQGPPPTSADHADVTRTDGVPVSTVDGLRDWLKEHIDYWDTFGWIDDRDVADKDGKTVFIRRPDGGVDIGDWSRGKIESVTSFPSEADAVQAAMAGPLIERVQAILRRRGLDRVITCRVLPSSAIGHSDSPPPDGEWAVVADRSTLLICHMTGTEMHVRERTTDPQHAVEIVAALHAQGPPHGPTGGRAL